MKEKFSLKDLLFNESKVRNLSLDIKRNDQAFDELNFTIDVVNKFPELELKQRITWISENLKKYLPKDYRTAVKIILESLPQENDRNKTDDDFGDFIYAPFGEFVAINGLDKKNLQFSLRALKEITMRFSVEYAIRYFINSYPKETLKELEKWTKDSHYHVRRLASEGTRPKLPWAQKININQEDSINILNNLFFDKTRFVTRSVANHMNDISKSNPELVLKTLNEWKESGQQNDKEMEFIINHSLRTLVKSGNKEAIEFLNFSSDPKVEIKNFTIKNPEIKIGESLEFEFSLEALADEDLIVDYAIYFQGKNENSKNKKVFKLKKLSMKKNQVIIISKSHKFKSEMTTRKLYLGLHKIEIQINGRKETAKTFFLV